MPRTPSGNALSAAERMRRHRTRQRAAGLRSVRAWAPREAIWSDHRVAEARSLALHVMAVQRINADSVLLRRARETLERWIERREGSRNTALLEWRELLARPWSEAAGLATALTEEGARLRQSSPLATILSADDRRRIHDAFRA